MHRLDVVSVLYLPVVQSEKIFLISVKLDSKICSLLLVLVNLALDLNSRINLLLSYLGSPLDMSSNLFWHRVLLMVTLIICMLLTRMKVYRRVVLELLLRSFFSMMGVVAFKQTAD